MWFLNHTQRRNTVGRTLLYEWSARRWDLYLTPHNTQKKQTSMPLRGIRTNNLSGRAAADVHLRPRGHWYRLFWRYIYLSWFRQRNPRFQLTFFNLCCNLNVIQATTTTYAHGWCMEYIYKKKENNNEFIQGSKAEHILGNEYTRVWQMKNDLTNIKLYSMPNVSLWIIQVYWHHQRYLLHLITTRQS